MILDKTKCIGEDNFERDKYMSLQTSHLMKTYHNCALVVGLNHVQSIKNYLKELCPNVSIKEYI